MGGKMHRPRLHFCGRIEEKSHIKVGDKRMRMSKDSTKVLTPPPLMWFITKTGKKILGAVERIKKQEKHIASRPMER